MNFFTFPSNPDFCLSGQIPASTFLKLHTSGLHTPINIMAGNKLFIIEYFKTN